MPSFTYQDYRSPLVPSIAELLARRGEIAARGAEVQGAGAAQSADIWGRAFAQAGQIPGQVMAQQRAEQDRQQEHALRAQQLASGQQQLDAHTETQQMAQTQRVVTTIGRLAKGADSLEEFVGSVNDMAALGALPKDVGAHILETAQKGGPDGWAATQKQYVDFAGQYAKTITLNQGDKAVNELTGQVVGENPKPTPLPTQASLAADAANPTSPTSGQSKGAIDLLQAPTVALRDETARHNAELERIAGLTAGRAEAAQRETARHNQAIEALEGKKVDAQASDKTDLTPEGLDIAALNFKKHGVLPPLGMGDKNTRKLIINRSGTLTTEDIARIEAAGNDIASNTAAYRADSESLKGLQKQRDAIGAFEQTAQKNIDVFLNAASKIADTGSPLLNTPVRMVTGKLLGAPDQAAYDAARQVAVNEIAKITSNPTLSGQLSDSARHEVEAFNPQNATLKQSIAVMKLLKNDMQNRTSALDDQIAGIKARIRKGAPQSDAGPKDGDTKPIPGFPGTEQTFRNGKWIRTK